MSYKTHGFSQTLFYKIWQSMMQRCYNPKAQAYSNYGARGIAVSEEWKTFENFMSDMLGTYAKDLTLDRIDNSKGYSKENCRWADMKTQNNNRRPKSCEYFLTFCGETLSILEWSKVLEMKYTTLLLRYRDRGWPAEKVLTTPAKPIHYIM